MIELYTLMPLSKTIQNMLNLLPKGLDFKNIYCIPLMVISIGLGFCLVHLVHWTQSDGDTYLKMDTSHHLNGSSTTRHWT